MSVLFHRDPLQDQIFHVVADKGVHGAVAGLTDVVDLELRIAMVGLKLDALARNVALQ